MEYEPQIRLKKKGNLNGSRIRNLSGLYHKSKMQLEARVGLQVDAPILLLACFPSLSLIEGGGGHLQMMNREHEGPGKQRILSTLTILENQERTGRIQPGQEHNRVREGNSNPSVLNPLHLLCYDISFGFLLFIFSSFSFYLLSLSIKVT